MSTALKLPTSPQEMWERLLMLLNTNGGFVSKKQVEDAIGVPFSETEKDGDSRVLGAAYLHSYKAEVPHLEELSMGMFEDPKRIIFFINWGAGSSANSRCLDFGKVSEDLKSLGFWGAERRAIPGLSPNVEFALWKDVEELRNQTTAAIDVRQEYEILRIFEESKPQLWVKLPRHMSQCVTGFKMQISSPNN